MDKKNHKFPKHFYDKYSQFMEGASSIRYQKHLDWNKLFPKLNGKCRCGCGLDAESYKINYKNQKGAITKTSIRYKRWFNDKHGHDAFIFFSFIKGMPNFFIGYLAKFQNYKCADCGTKKEYAHDFEADHNIALILGGNNLPENWQLLCHGCHKNKTKIDLMCMRFEAGKLKGINDNISKSQIKINFNYNHAKTEKSKNNHAPA